MELVRFSTPNRAQRRQLLRNLVLYKGLNIEGYQRVGENAAYLQANSSGFELNQPPSMASFVVINGSWSG